MEIVAACDPETFHLRSKATHGIQFEVNVIARAGAAPDDPLFRCIARFLALA